MRIPEDWDKPSDGNDQRCALFEYGKFEHHGRIVPYRLFEPKVESESGLPLVLYLHGADAVGNDNEQPLSIHDIGTMFARQEWQDHDPCYILAPQYKRSMHWAAPGMQEVVHDLVMDIVSTRPDIDMSRIYIYGYSAGGIGTLECIKKYPDFYAGALVICGATYDEEIDKLESTPMWLFHAEDDAVVPCGSSSFFPMERVYMGSRPLYERLSGIMGDGIRYTEYPRGRMKKTYGINPHCTWVPVASDEEAKKWLFNQRKSS